MHVVRFSQASLSVLITLSKLDAWYITLELETSPNEKQNGRFPPRGRIVSFPDAPPTRGKERLVTIDANLGPNDVIYPAVVECAIIISRHLETPSKL